MIERFLARFRVGEYFSSRYVPSWSVLALDTVVSVGASFFALLVLRALLPSPMLTAPRAVALLAASALFSLVSFGVFRTFRSVIRHSTLRGVWKLVAAVLLKDSLLYLFVSLLLGDGILPPKTAAAGFLLDGLLTLFLLLAVRLTMLVLYDLVQRRADGGGNALRTLVYGTGDKEIALAVRLQHSPHYRIAGFLTYGRQLKRYTIAERPVCYFENRASIAYLVGKRGIDAVLFSSPAAARDERERLVKYCTEAGVRVLVAPPIDEVTDGRLMKQVVREIHTVARPVGDRVHIPQRDRVGDRGKCFSGALHIARDDGRHLFARDRRVRFKAPAAHTVDDVLLRGPFDIRRVPAPGRDIGEGNARVVRFVDLHKPAQHRHEHGARERVIRRETSAADAVHETVGSNVFHGISIPCTGGHIHEARDGSAR